jgi:hypothetical protein
VPNYLDRLGKRRAKRSRKVPDGPPQKRRPALAANKRRANRRIKKSQRKNNTKAGQDSQATDRHFFWITHGQTNLGFVEQIGETYKALDSDEQPIGLFDTLKGAADAVGAACEAVR